MTLKIIALCASITLLFVVLIIIFLARKKLLLNSKSDSKTVNLRPWAYEAKRPIAWVETSRKSNKSDTQSSWSITLVVITALIVIIAAIFSQIDSFSFLQSIKNALFNRF